MQQIINDKQQDNMVSESNRKISEKKEIINKWEKLNHKEKEQYIDRLLIF
jgi:hypothetical protein